MLEYLSDQCINNIDDKPKLVENVYSAYRMCLPIIYTDAKSEMEELHSDYKHLTDGWVAANIPDTTHVMIYLREQMLAVEVCWIQLFPM